MSKVAAIQMASGPNVKANLAEAEKLIQIAVQQGAELIVLPENFAIMGTAEDDKVKIAEEAGCRWEILDALIIHRVGAMEPGEPIVLVAVWAAHRAAAFDACRYLIEELKSRAPFWKKEKLAEGERWVEKNTPG